MGSLDYHRMVIAYHGCDRETVRSALDGRPLQSSERAYDWLGRGLYFWEHGPRRALEWAETRSRRGDGVVKTPAVLGAYLNLGRCFDLLDTANTAFLTDYYSKFVEFNSMRGTALPQNRSPHGTADDELSLRFLDCAYINWILDRLDTEGLSFQTVRGAFVEGGPCFPGTKLMTKTHIQIAVRDHSCILGLFRPHGLTGLPS
jgi:hypothetical protein